MKTKWTFIIVLFFFQCSAQDSTLPITIDIRVDRDYERIKSKDAYISAIRDYGYIVKTDSVRQKYFDITLKFKNTSNRQTSVWLMRCSFEDNLVVNNNSISIEGHECDSNYPSLVKLEPGESRILNLTLAKSIKFDYPCKYCVYGQQVETTKIGLVIIDDIFESKLNGQDYDLAMEDKSKWMIIWSNPLQLLSKQSQPKRKTVNV